MRKSLVEIHRREYENIVIDLINRGWFKSDAEHEAKERIEERYGVDEEE